MPDKRPVLTERISGHLFTFSSQLQIQYTESSLSSARTSWEGTQNKWACEYNKRAASGKATSCAGVGRLGSATCYLLPRYLRLALERSWPLAGVLCSSYGFASKRLKRETARSVQVQYRGVILQKQRQIYRIGGMSDYARKIEKNMLEKYAFARHPWNKGIMIKIMLG